MPLLGRKKLLLAKIESTYGVDSVPTGSANAILLRNLNIAPLDAETVNRDLVRSYFGISDILVANSKVSMDFEIELAGSGVIGDAPAWGPLLQACGFARVGNTSAISITRTGSVATATLAAHGFTNGSRVEISGALEPECNGGYTI